MLLPQPPAAAPAAPAPPGGWNLENPRFLPRAVILHALRPCGQPGRGHARWSHSVLPPPRGHPPPGYVPVVTLQPPPRAVTLRAATPRGHPSLAYALPWALVVFTLIHSLARYVLDLTGLQETSPALGVGLRGV